MIAARPISLVPMVNHIGETVWTMPYNLGVVSQATVTTVNNTTSAAGAAAQAISQIKGGGGDVTTAGKIAQVAGTVAAIAAVIPGVGTVVAVVAGIVAGAALLVNAIWGTSKDKARLREAGEYNKINDMLLLQIQQVDEQTRNVQSGLTKLNDSLKAVGLSGIDVPAVSLGSASDILSFAKDSATQLQKTLDEKTTVLVSLIDTFNKSVQNTYDLITGKNQTSKIVLWSIAGLAAAGLAYFAFDSLNNKKS